jgi:hypothetical protein
MWNTIVGANPTYEAAAFEERYIEEWGVIPSECQSFACYDQIMLWAEAVEAVGDESNYVAITDWIMNNHVPGMTWGPGGSNFCSTCRSDRTCLTPYVEKCHSTLLETGMEYGTSLNYYEIKKTSDGPQHVLISMHGIPTAEYMSTYYGYPPQDKYIKEVGSEFQVPWWIRGVEPGE